jgi:hypothetical protein
MYFSETYTRYLSMMHIIDPAQKSKSVVNNLASSRENGG